MQPVVLVLDRAPWTLDIPNDQQVWVLRSA
jgi:hypothetical protein